MARRFVDAKVLLGDLIDRHEGGVPAPVGYPDHAAFPSVTASDTFLRIIRSAEAKGAVETVEEKGRRRGELKLVRLREAPALYEFLERRPASESAADALGAVMEGLTLHDGIRAAVASAADVWAKGKSWCNLGPGQVAEMRSAVRLAQAIVEGQHRESDYRTFSRRIASNSKALERLEAAVLRLVASCGVEVPPSANPRQALAALGLERFAPPLLIGGAVTIDGIEMPSMPYLAIPPREIARLGFGRVPDYVLSVENFASFNRHCLEADPGRRGLTLYVGGYPAIGTQEALRHLGTALAREVPFFHWSDIDPDGTWIFRTIERALSRPLVPHLMDASLAQEQGDEMTRAHGLRPGDAAGTRIGALVEYLRSPGARTLEQEALDPVIPHVGPTG